MKASITLLILFAAEAFARGSKGGSFGGGSSYGDGGGVNSNPLELAPEDIAALVFYIFFLLFALGSTLFILAKRPRGQYPRQTAVIALLLATLISFLISYSLGTYRILAGGEGIETDWDTVKRSSFADDFFWNFGQMTFFAAICLVLDWRARQPSDARTLSQNGIMFPVFRIGVPTLLVGMFVFTIVYLGLEASGEAHAYYSNGGGIIYAENRSAAYAASAMSHLYIAFYALLAILIVTTTLSIWRNRSVKVESDLTEFDKRVTSRILHSICPAISIAASYMIIADIVTNLDRNPFLVAISAVVYALVYGIAIFVGIKLGS